MAKATEDKMETQVVEADGTPEAEDQTRHAGGEKADIADLCRRVKKHYLACKKADEEARQKEKAAIPAMNELTEAMRREGIRTLACAGMLFEAEEVDGPFASREDALTVTEIQKTIR